MGGRLELGIGWHVNSGLVEQLLCEQSSVLVHSATERLLNIRGNIEILGPLWCGSARMLDAILYSRTVTVAAEASKYLAAPCHL